MPELDRELVPVLPPAYGGQALAVAGRMADGPHPQPLSLGGEGRLVPAYPSGVRWAEGAKLVREGRVRTDGEGEETSVRAG